MTRGSGRTTKQIREAPVGAMFVAPHRDAARYMKALARYLDRDDLVIATPSVFDAGAYSLRGARFPTIIVDHATELTPRQSAVLERERSVFEMMAKATTESL